MMDCLAANPHYSFRPFAIDAVRPITVLGTIVRVGGGMAGPLG